MASGVLLGFWPAFWDWCVGCWGLFLVGFLVFALVASVRNPRGRWHQRNEWLEGEDDQ